MNYKDLPEINDRIKALGTTVENWDRNIAHVKRFQPDSDLVREYSECQSKVKAEIQDLQQQHDEIIRQMDMDEQTKTVLLLHYDTGKKWQDVADAIGVSLRQVHRIRSRAEQA